MPSSDEPQAIVGIVPAVGIALKDSNQLKATIQIADPGEIPGQTPKQVIPAIELHSTNLIVNPSRVVVRLDDVQGRNLVKMMNDHFAVRRKL